MLMDDADHERSAAFSDDASIDHEKETPPTLCQRSQEKSGERGVFATSIDPFILEEAGEALHEAPPPLIRRVIGEGGKLALTASHDARDQPSQRLQHLSQATFQLLRIHLMELVSYATMETESVVHE
jgi:hypothetical protein